MPSDEPAPQSRHTLHFVLRAASSLVAMSAVTSALGFVYWLLAARHFNPVSVGKSSTSIAAMSLIAPFTVLGLGTLLVTRLPTMTTGGRARLVSTAACVTGLAGALVAAACAFLLPDDYVGIPNIGHEFGITVLFIAATATQGIGMLLDNALLSVLGGGTQLKRNAIQAVAKLVLLFLLAAAWVTPHGSFIIFTSWFAANALSIAFVGFSLMRRFHVRPAQLWPKLSALRGLHVDAFRHHLLNIALFVPFFAMPIVANVTLGNEQAGHFYIAWSIAGLLFYLPISLSTALFASGSRSSRNFLGEFHFTVRTSLLICAAANLALLALGPWILGFIGSSYAAEGRVPLAVIALGGLGLVIKDHHVVLARITKNVGREGFLIAALSAGEIAGAAIGGLRNGLLGLAIGWTAAVALEALVCTPWVWRAYRGRVAVPDQAKDVVIDPEDLESMNLDPTNLNVTNLEPADLGPRHLSNDGKDT